MLWKPDFEFSEFNFYIFESKSRGEENKNWFWISSLKNKNQLETFFLFWPTDLIKLKLFLSNFDFDWFVGNFILKKFSGKLLFFCQIFLTMKKMIFEWFQKWPRKTNNKITWLYDRGRNNLETGITWPFSVNLSVPKNPAQKINLYFRNSQNCVFWKKGLNKTLSGKRRWEVGSLNPVIAFHLSRTP